MYNLAIIGYGGMGSWHASSIRKHIDRINIKGIYDIRQERQEQALKDGLYTYNSVDEICADNDIDIVTIATPNNFHKELAIKVMQSGKHVVIEKPAAVNASDYEDIIKVSKETGKILTTHQNRRWDKDFNIIKKIYDDLLIGDFYMIESRVQGSRQVLHGWRDSKFNGGGMVYDWGVHLIDQILFMINSPVVSVYSNLYGIFSKEVDDNFKTVIKFKNGISALIEVSMNCFILHPRWHISADKGTAVIENWDCEGRMVMLNEESEMPWEEKIVYTSAGPTRSMAPRPSETVSELSLPAADPDWSEFYNNILSVIEGKEELRVKPCETLRVLKVMDAIFESDKLNRSVECEI